MLMSALLEHRDAIGMIIAALFLLCCHPLKAAAPEWILSGLLFCMAASNTLFEVEIGGPLLWREADMGHFAVDSLAMGSLVVVALYANPEYPLWMAGAQLITLTAHLFRVGMSDISAFAYAAMAMFPSYVQLVAMAIGLTRHAMRRHHWGPYRSWRHPDDRGPFFRGAGSDAQRG